MRSIILTTVTRAGAAQAEEILNTGRRLLPAAGCARVCFGDVEPAEGIADFHIKDLAGEYLHKAFFFEQDEMETYGALLAIDKLLEDYDVALFLSRPVKDAAAPLSFQSEGIYRLLAAERGREHPVLTDTALARAACQQGMIAFCRGGGVSAFVRSCVKTFEHIYHRMLAPDYDEIYFGVQKPWRLNRDFCRTFWMYAPLMGVRLHPVPASTCILGGASASPWPHGAFCDGTPVASIIRLAAQKYLPLKDVCADDPFAHPECFFERDILCGETRLPVMSYAIKTVYDTRPDLHRAFPDPWNGNRVQLAQWFCETGAREYSLPPRYYAQTAADLETVRTVRAREGFVKKALRRLKKSGHDAVRITAPSAPGVNLCGFIKIHTGLGESCRIMANMLEHYNVPFEAVSFHPGFQEWSVNQEYAHKVTNRFDHKCNLMILNGEDLMAFLRDVAPGVTRGRYNIGYWAWEVPEFPAAWEDALPCLNEIWTCSDFVSECVRQVAKVPVLSMPHAIRMEPLQGKTRADFDLPADKFIFIMSYDVRSLSGRKNPQAAIKAFMHAFGGRDDVRLLVKVNAPREWKGDDEALLREAIAGGNVIVYNRMLSRGDMNELMNCCDAMVSLHRSEGFGLAPAEMMYLGKPAVLTNWSGNTQYMRDGACCPVDYKIVEIDRDYGPYKKGWHWAEPDLDSAAVQMRRLVDDPAYYKTIAQNGQKVIREEFSIAAIGAKVQARLRELSII